MKGEFVLISKLHSNNVFRPVSEGGIGFDF